MRESEKSGIKKAGCGKTTTSLIRSPTNLRYVCVLFAHFHYTHVRFSHTNEKRKESERKIFYFSLAKL